jgi:hypothetical protein
MAQVTISVAQIEAGLLATGWATAIVLGASWLQLAACSVIAPPAGICESQRTGLN